MQAKFDAVKSYMTLRSPLALGDQYLSMLGDQAAFFVYTVMVNRPPLSAAETLTALDIVHKAFARPKFIHNEGDQTPDNALTLLKVLQESAVDEAVKTRIVVETNFLYAVPRHIVRDPMVPPGPPPARAATPFR